MRKIIATILIFIFSLALATPVMASDPAGNAYFASSFDFRDTFEEFQEGVEEQSTELEEGVESIVLPTFQDQTEDGVSGVVNAMFEVLDFLKLVIAPLAVLFIVIMGIKMVTAGSESEEIVGKAKSYITNTLIGLALIFVADSMVGVMFGAEGEVFRGGESGALEFARQTENFMEGIYTLVQTVIGAVAVFSLVMAGMRFVGGSYDEEQITGAKRQITWALVGLFIIAISEFVAKDILFAQHGQAIGVDAAKDLFANVTNFVAGTIGTLSFAAMLYAGYLYVTARENDDMISKAKQVITGAVIGILLAGAAFAITNTLIELDVSR